MPFDFSLLGKSIEQVYGDKPHPSVPEVKVRDYEAFARVAARMFYERRPTAEHIATAHRALTSADISPGEFERLWDVAKPLANRLLSRDPTIHDLASLDRKSV